MASDPKRDLLLQLASHWSLQTHRNSCVITGPCKSEEHSRSGQPNPTSIHWDWLETTGQPVEKSPKALARDIATLGHMRAENGVIRSELGKL
ncbi:MAG: hypothetical protein ACKO9Q_22400, partial [Pirellula sp.]